MKCVDCVYDFVLLLLVFYVFFKVDVVFFKLWFVISLCNVIMVLDMYDGIGVIDVGVDVVIGCVGLLLLEVFEELVEMMYCKSGDESC